MKITRDGKTYELTKNELNEAYWEVLYEKWRIGIEDAIDRNNENLRFGTEFTQEEFIEECVLKIQEDLVLENDDDEYDDVLFDVAESYGVWCDDYEED